MNPTPHPDLTRQVLECVEEVHRELGPGLGKDVYANCLGIELTKAGLPFERGRVLTFIYDGHQLDFTCEADIIVDDGLLLQVEAADAIEPGHEQRLRTCLYMGEFPVGLLLNFNVVEMEDGIIQLTDSEADRSPQPFHDVFDDPEPGSTF